MSRLKADSCVFTGHFVYIGQRERARARVSQVLQSQVYSDQFVVSHCEQLLFKCGLDTKLETGISWADCGSLLTCSIKAFVHPSFD